MSQRTNSRRMHTLREQFFAEGQRLDADDATRDQSVCWICKGRIDYDAAPGTTDQSHELDHYHPVSLRPDLQEDPTNFRHAHARCNAERGNRQPTTNIGETVPDWW